MENRKLKAKWSWESRLDLSAMFASKEENEKLLEEYNEYLKTLPPPEPYVINHAWQEVEVVKKVAPCCPFCKNSLKENKWCFGPGEDNPWLDCGCNDWK